MGSATQSEAPVSQQEAWARFGREAAPDWVEPVDPPAEAEEDGPVTWLLYDEQYRLAPVLERYVRTVRRAESDVGVGWLAEIRIQFNPSYETLTLHGATIIRNGSPIDALADADLDFMRVEEDMHARVYRGDYVLIVQLRMLEPGDVLDVAHTISGHNPVYAGRLDLSLYLTFSVPVGRQYCRVLRPVGADIGVSAKGPALALEENVRDGWVELRLDRRDVPRHEFEQHVPPELDDQSSVLHFSGFGDWGEVASWGAALYRLEGDEAVEDLARACLEQSAEPPELAAIAYVQDRIRYVSTCFGEGGYRPRGPDVIVSRRYGDCKDKALLLAAVLRRLGHDADVALISSDRPMAPVAAFPGPGAFNHVIVRLRLDGETFWIDATMTGQRGPLPLRSRPHSAAVLVLRPDVRALEILPAHEERHVGAFSDGVIDLSAGPGQPAVMAYTNVSVGSDAETMRRWLAASGAAGLERDFRDHASEELGEVEQDGPFEVEDDPETNTFRVTNRLRLLDPWHVTPEGGWEFRTTICNATTLLPTLPSNRRSRPLSLLVHPLHHRHRELIRLPDGDIPAGLAVGEIRRRNEGFEFVRTTEAEEGGVSVTVETRTLAPWVPAASLRAAYGDEAALQLGHKLHLVFPPSPA